MKLPLSAENTALVLALLDRLTAIDARPVLVGGLVPPLLVEALEPDQDLHLPPRATGDCDVAFVTSGPPTNDAASTAVLEALGFTRRQQFRWRHDGGLFVDAMPVAPGIESGAPDAVAFARTFVPQAPQRFFHGYELALARPRVVQVELDDGTMQAIAIADVTAMLAMKLQAFNDRPYDRPRDAYDVVWLARHLDPELIGRDLIACRDVRAELVDEVVARLERDFGDLWSRGISSYFDVAFSGRRSFDEESRREAGAQAIAALLDAYHRASA